MKLLLLSLVALISASAPREFLRGFLSGFQDTEVVLGEECLDAVWAKQVESNFNILMISLKNKEYLSVFSAGSDLFKEFVAESNECHLPDLLRIIESIKSISKSDKLFRLVANLPKILLELESAGDPNMYVCGYHIGKALVYLEKEDSKLPDFSGNAIGDVFAGFIGALVTKTDKCNASIDAFENSIKRLIDTLNLFLNGSGSTIQALQLQFAMTISGLLKVKNNCDAVNLPQKFYNAFFTKEGLTSTYIKFGMSMQEITKIKNSGIVDILSKD